MKNRVVAIIVSLLAVILILSVFVYFKKRTRNAVEKFIESGKMINVLVAGSNSYNKNKHVFYAILSCNTGNNKIGITFIPPEFRVDLDGKGKKYQKINEISIKDFKSLSESLERDLKLNIPFYIALYSPDVERIVDLIEGIDLYVLDSIDVPGIQFGPNYFDGDKIIQYINKVNENSIYKKYDRIQDILLTLYYNKEKYEKFLNIEFISEILKTIKTNFLPQEIFSFCKLLFKKKSDLKCTTLPGFINEKNYYVSDDITYKIYKSDFLRKLIVENDTDPQIKVKILNGTDIPGLARKVRRKFVNEGFNVVEFGTAPYPSFEKTIIVNRRGETGPLRKISELVGSNNIYHITDSSQLINVSIILGMDLAK